MIVLLVIIWVILLCLLIAAVSIYPERTNRSWFELKRLDDKVTMRREKLLGGILGLRRVIIGITLIGMVSVGFGLLQALGVIITISVWLLSGAIGRFEPIHRQVMKQYESVEPRILVFVESAPIIGWLTRTNNWRHPDEKLESSEQLVYLVESAHHILTADQRMIITKGLNWHKTAVKEIMTPKKDIVSIGYRELLGPLVLDDLHRSGHDRFPVIQGTIDEVVGTLNITEMLEVDATKRSQTAEKAMSANVLRVEANEPLPAALALLQKSHQHLLIVIDSHGKTVGLITLGDITGSLLGQDRGEVIK